MEYKISLTELVYHIFASKQFFPQFRTILFFFGPMRIRRLRIEKRSLKTILECYIHWFTQMCFCISNRLWKLENNNYRKRCAVGHDPDKFCINFSIDYTIHSHVDSNAPAEERNELEANKLFLISMKCEVEACLNWMSRYPSLEHSSSTEILRAILQVTNHLENDAVSRALIVSHDKHTVRSNWRSSKMNSNRTNIWVSANAWNYRKRWI